MCCTIVPRTLWIHGDNYKYSTSKIINGLSAIGSDKVQSVRNEEACVFMVKRGTESFLELSFVNLPFNLILIFLELLASIPLSNSHRLGLDMALILYLKSCGPSHSATSDCKSMSVFPDIHCASPYLCFGCLTLQSHISVSYHKEK